MKNVIIISSIKIYNGNSAGSARLMNIAKALASIGLQVYLCSSVLKKSVNLSSVQQVLPNIFVIGFEGNKSEGKIKRKLFSLFNAIPVLKYILCVVNLAKSINGEKVFYVYPNNETSLDVMSLIVFKYLYGYKTFCDINEVRKTTIYNIEFSENLIVKFYQWIHYILWYIKFSFHEKITRYYDGLVVISSNIEQYFKKYNNNLLLVPILSDVTNAIPVRNDSFKIGDCFKIGFSGQISLLKEGFDNFYRALAIVKSKYDNFELNLYGEITKYEKELLLKLLPNKYGIHNNILYYGVINQSSLLKELKKNHLLVLPRPLTPQTNFGFSTKLSEYLVSGIPVLVTDVSDNSLYIKDGENGFIVEPGNYELMAEKIIHIIYNYETFKKFIGINAFETAKKYFHYENYSAQLKSLFFK